MARLLSAAARPASPIHTAVSVFGSLRTVSSTPNPGSLRHKSASDSTSQKYRSFSGAPRKRKWITVRPGGISSVGTELPIVAPSSDGTRGVCVFKSDSVNTVRNLVEAAAGKISSNEYHAINEGNAQGLPV
jgi:hypothetical protein